MSTALPGTSGGGTAGDIALTNRPDEAVLGETAGSLSCDGLRNTYYWLEPATQVTGLILTQILPLADLRVLALYRAFESSIL
jgi:hypothetical protein